MAKKKSKKTNDKYTKDVRELWFKKREVFLSGRIDDEKAYEIIRELKALDSIENKVITLYINTPGGCVLSGLAIIDTINSLKSKVNTVITGMACSMGSFISLVGNKRYMTKNAFWMAHQMATYLSDYVQVAKDHIEAIEKFEKALDNIYKTNCKLSKKDVEKYSHGELWLSSKECLKRKIVDRII